MLIESLSKNQNLLSELARWHFEEWGPLTGSASLEEYTANLERFASSDAVPSVLVAKSGRELLGSASLLPSDLPLRSELTPWLAQLFVLPRHRGRGIGASLVHSAVSAAGQLGFSALYLYTSGDLPAFYRQLGWSTRETVTYLGKERTVMQFAKCGRGDR